ncbi:MAG: pseudaminic acid synthase [Firmicutes bacterium]|nr:pseudaminic acid synthase [Bacillota bacterium]
MKDIRIGDLLIGVKNRPVIVAELSGNHNQSLERALAIVDAAAKAGAQAFKIQTYTADTMTLDIDQNEFHIGDPDSLWQGHSLYSLYKEAYTPWEWHKAIFDRCHQLGMIGFSTPFDETAVDFLESLDVPCYKVASFENTDLPLIRRIAATGKPLIISTGMATLAELDEMVSTAREAGCRDLILLKCTSSYPASPADSNLMTIPHMAELFDCQVGLSDHTMGIGAAIAAVTIGATIIEKHFTLSRLDGGVDTTFSLEPPELKQLVEQADQAWLALGRVSYGTTEAEKSSQMFRRSLYVAKDMKAGDVFSRENLRIIRPGLGLAPKYFDLVLGKKVAMDVTRGTPVNWDLIGSRNN